jgi:hypothetical protein
MSARQRSPRPPELSQEGLEKDAEGDMGTDTYCLDSKAGGDNQVAVK